MEREKAQSPAVCVKAAKGHSGLPKGLCCEHYFLGDLGAVSVANTLSSCLTPARALGIDVGSLPGTEFPRAFAYPSNRLISTSNRYPAGHQLT